MKEPESTSSPPTTVHTVEQCRHDRRRAFAQGACAGALLALAFALGAGIGAAYWQEGIFDHQLKIVQAQHRIALETERKKVERYAEIDALATAYDQALSRQVPGGGR